MRLLRILFLAITLIDEAEGSLHAARGADMVAELMKRAQVGDLGNIELGGENLEAKTGIGSSGLSNRETWVGPGIQQQDAEAMAGENGAEHASANSTADNDHVVIGL